MQLQLDAGAAAVVHDALAVGWMIHRGDALGEQEAEPATTSPLDSHSPWS